MSQGLDSLKWLSEEVSELVDEPGLGFGANFMAWEFESLLLQNEKKCNKKIVF